MQPSDHTVVDRIRTYYELSKLKTFEERFLYLKIDGKVGMYTFGGHRDLNQSFYQNDKTWKIVRRKVINRDLGNDLGIEGMEILGKIVIHHMNPITVNDFLRHDPKVYDPEYLICTSDLTHKLIHYGNLEDLKAYSFTERKPFDTCEWKRGN